MKVAFVSANRETMPDAVVPLGLLYVMANAPEHCDCELWDLCFEPEPLSCLALRLQEFRPDVVAVAIRNIQVSDYTDASPNLAYYGSLMETIREHSRAPLVVGGPGFSVLPGPLMEHLKPDFGICGEGERGFAQLVEQLKTGENDYGEIENLYFFADGQLQSVPSSEAFQDLNQLTPPDRARADQRYYDEYRIESIQTKRGCVSKCNYCTYPLIEGRRIRLRDPNSVVAELLEALEVHPSIAHVFVVDAAFNLPREHASAVCRAMTRSDFATPWTCYASPLVFNAELADLMVAAGCAGLEIGSDSGSDEVLGQLAKGFGTAEILEMHDICQAAGLPDCHSFMLGTPGESLEHVARTLDFVEELDPFAAIFTIWVDDSESLDTALANSRRAFRDQIEDLVRSRVKPFTHWSVPPLGIRFNSRLFRVLRKNGFTGPLWRHIRKPPVGRSRTR